MYMTFILWRHVHVVLIQVFQISIRIGWSRKSLALKLYASYGEYGVLPVHYAISIVDEHIRHVCVMRTKGRDHAPQNFAAQVFRSEIEKLKERTGRIIMLRMKYAVADRYAFGHFLHP